MDESAPFEFELPVPAEAIGAFELAAVGQQTDGSYTRSNTVTVSVVPDQPLDKVSIAEQELSFTAGDTSQQLTVLGQYSDGIIRNITDPDTATVYTSSDPSVVQVSAQGLITAVDTGVATIVALNGTVQDSITVRVISENQAPVADAGVDQRVTQGEVVVLDGSGSFDPDANTDAELAYEWYQIAGPPVTLLNPTTAHPSFKAQQQGLYVFSLLVRDGQDDSIPDSVTIKVGFIEAFLPVLNK